MASQPTLPFPPGGDETRAPTIIGVLSALTALSILCTSARLYSRMRLLRNQGWDDALIVLSVILVIISLGLVVTAAHFGVGRHEYYLSPINRAPAMKYLFTAGFFAFMSISIPKLAVVIFLSRIIGPATAKRPQILFLYALTISHLVLSLICSILTVGDCPIHYHPWDADASQHCLNPSIVIARFSLFVGGSNSLGDVYEAMADVLIAYSAAVDLILAIFPVTIIFQLQMPLGRRIAISLIMGAGIFACVCAIMRTYYTADLSSFTDWTWKASDNVIWSSAEQNVVIICACVPTLLPLVQKVTGSKDYLSKEKPNQRPDQRKYHDVYGSQRSQWRDVHLMPLKNEGTVDSRAFHEDQGDDGSPHRVEVGIRKTMEVQTQWEAV